MSQTLFIIDGHAQIYRAYYAVTGLTSPSGEPTGATFGYVNMLFKLFQVRKPTHVVLAMDAGTSGREAVDASYKAQRKPMPEDMPQQIDRILQISETLEIPLFRAEGFEADDAIATLVRKIRTDPTCGDCKIYMCTKDKDLDQLIDDQCVMFDIQANEEMNAAGLVAKKGYTPAQARDVLALTGDAVDNIPGIPGVGPKTAAKWIAQYGTIDNLIARKDEITGKIGEAFRQNLHVLENSRKLVELQFDVPIQAMDWTAAQVHPEKLPALAPIFHQLGFSKLLTLLDQVLAQYRDQLTAAPLAPPKAPTQPSPATPAVFNAASATAARSGKPARSNTPPPSGGLFDQVSDEVSTQPTPTEEDEITLATAAPEHAMQTDSELVDQRFMAPRDQATGLRPVEGEYVLVNTPQKLDAMLATLRQQLEEARQNSRTPWLAVDTETDALGSMSSNLCGISLSAKEGTGFYVAVRGAVEDVLDETVVRDCLGPLLSDDNNPKAGQNLKYDLNALRNFGLQLNGVDFDSMVASYVRW